MTIERAREILQEEIADLSDEQVIEFIQRTGSFADSLLDIAVKQHLTQEGENANNG